MKLTRRALAAVAVVVTFAAIGCGSDSSTGPDAPSPILGVQATAKGATSIMISFNGNAGDATDRTFGIDVRRKIVGSHEENPEEPG